MIRSAAKNHRFVLVVTDPGQYEKVLGDLRKHGGILREASFQTGIGGLFDNGEIRCCDHQLFIKPDSLPASAGGNAQAIKFVV